MRILRYGAGMEGSMNVGRVRFVYYSDKTSKEIRNLIRGLNPMPGAYTLITGERMKIWSAEFTTFNDEICKPGEIVKADSKSGLLIKTGDGILEITELQMPNLKRMSARDYLRGHKINF